MAEILVRGMGASNPSGYKLGMGCVVKPDGHAWGQLERLPLFAVIKFPLISVSRVEKYVAEYRDAEGSVIERRRWQIRWADLPLAARDKLRTTGELIIKATDLYTGAFDYTWAQVKQFWRNLQTGLDETEDL